MVLVFASCTSWEELDDDEDGVLNGEEEALGTDPSNADSDGDGIGDGEELDAGTDPTLSDTDGDGLSDSEESEFGTDPLAEDSDEDGYSDGDEVAGNTDPLASSDHPYQGGWPIGACRDDVTSTGDAEGQISATFELSDQFGEMVKLHDFCDKAVLIVAGAFW